MCIEDVLKLTPLLLGIAVISGCSQRGQLVGATSVAQLDVPDQIAVGFNHQHHNRYRSPITGEWRDGDDIEQILVRAIDLAEREFCSPSKNYRLQRSQTHSSRPSSAE